MICLDDTLRVSSGDHHRSTLLGLWSTDGLETPMISGTPAPFGRACVEAVDDAMRARHPSHAMSATQRAWLAFGVTAVLITTAMCWARLERASLGTDSLAAWSGRFRHRQMPWDTRLVARVRVIWRPHDLTSGHLVIDDPDNPRSQSAKALAPRDKRRDQESGGDLWGQSLVLLVWVTPPNLPSRGRCLLSAGPCAPCVG